MVITRPPAYIKEKDTAESLPVATLLQCMLMRIGQEASKACQCTAVLQLSLLATVLHCHCIPLQLTC